MVKGTTDYQLGDYIVGQAIGQSYNSYSSMGAQYAADYSAPYLYLFGDASKLLS